MTPGCLARVCIPLFLVSVVAAVSVYPAVFDVDEVSRYGMTHTLPPSRADFGGVTSRFAVSEPQARRFRPCAMDGVAFQVRRWCVD